MSNPFSKDPTKAPGADSEEPRPLGARVSSLESKAPEQALEEVTYLDEATYDESESERPGSASPAAPPLAISTRSGKSSRRLTLILLVLLLGSVAFNVWQWQERSALNARSDEFEIALTQAVEKLDQQTVRALDAEGTLSSVDDAMGNVRVRILELQQALDELAGAATR